MEPFIQNFFGLLRKSKYIIFVPQIKSKNQSTFLFESPSNHHLHLLNYFSQLLFVILNHFFHLQHKFRFFLIIFLSFLCNLFFEYFVLLFLLRFFYLSKYLVFRNGRLQLFEEVLFLMDSQTIISNRGLIHYYSFNKYLDFSFIFNQCRYLILNVFMIRNLKLANHQQ